MTTLSQKALLVNLRISTWQGRRFDKKATNTVAETHETHGAVGQFNKKLLPEAKELREVLRVAGSLRAYLYENTLPWLSDGSRIIAAKHYIDFSKGYREIKDEYEAAINTLVTEYPRLRDEAKTKLGDLFNSDDYPTAEALRSAYGCEIFFSPLPDAKDFRVQLQESEIDAFNRRIKEAETAATRNCIERLANHIQNAIARLSEKDPVFRDSLIENIREQVALTSVLNVMDDPQVESIRRELDKALAGINADDCRKSKAARQDAADKLAEINKKMSVFMGG